MRNIIVKAMNVNTNSIVTINMDDFVCEDETDRLFATPQGLFFTQNNGDFTDIVDFNRLKRKEYGEWVEYTIKRYTVEGKTYRFVKNRNLYNKKDKPVIMEVDYD